MMKKWLSIISAGIFCLFILSSCGSARIVIPESELKTYNSKKVLELGAEKYSNYDYDSAIYYYEMIDKLFPEDMDARSWATYEIGYIKFAQNRYSESLTYFDSVLQMKISAPAVQLLAAKMREKALTKITKK